MHLASKRIKALWLCGGFALGVVATLGAKPLYQRALQQIHRTAFYALTEGCDSAMRVHLVAKNRLEVQPSAEAVQQLRSAELGLIACQDYDLMRKRLIRLGLDDNALSEMTLEFAEALGRDLQLVVETHEFRY